MTPPPTEPPKPTELEKLQKARDTYEEAFQDYMDALKQTPLDPSDKVEELIKLWRQWEDVPLTFTYAGNPKAVSLVAERIILLTRHLESASRQHPEVFRHVAKSFPYWPVLAMRHLYFERPSETNIKDIVEYIKRLELGSDLNLKPRATYPNPGQEKNLGLWLHSTLLENAELPDLAVGSLEQWTDAAMMFLRTCPDFKPAQWLRVPLEREAVQRGRALTKGELTSQLRSKVKKALSSIIT